MAFNVNSFRSQMTGDGARPNLFEVTLTFPNFSDPGDAGQKLTFMCNTAQLPGADIGVVPVQYFGRELKFAGNRVFQEWTINVLNDEDFKVRNAFERWLVGINSHRENLRLPDALAPVGYTRDGQVIQYGKTGNVLKRYNFIGVFPSNIAPIDLNWGANDEIEQFAVTLQYQWWESPEDGIQ